MKKEYEKHVLLLVCLCWLWIDLNENFRWTEYG